VIAGYAPIHLGTGFIVGKDQDRRAVLMTNAHVVEPAITYGWPTVEGVTLACDFARYTMDNENSLVPLAGAYRLHPRYDLALLYLHPNSDAGAAPLALSAAAPIPEEGLRIGVVGHPAFDAKHDPFPSYFGFGNKFGIKRLAPGYIRLVENRHWRNSDGDIFLHDATTLEGNSGSAIFDLDTLLVIGLHFGGWPKPQLHPVQADGRDFLAKLFYANGAVPLWLMRDDPLLACVRFV